MQCTSKLIEGKDVKKCEESKKKSDNCVPEGTVQIQNPYLPNMKSDYLYHLNLGTETHDLVAMFNDVRFVCMGGTAKRMENFAHYIMKEIDYKLPTGAELQDICKTSQRFAMYKVGPVLSVSHGMGTPSIGILLNEILKLLYYAKAQDPVIFRIGTCGGIGIKGGTVVIANGAVNGRLEDVYELPVLGKLMKRPAIVNQELAEELKSLIDLNDSYETVTGKTLAADDFYEGEGRIDGVFCDYTEEDKMEFLHRIHQAGVVNMEMESTVFAAFTHHADVRSANVCVAFLDRLQGDQVDIPKDTLEEWQGRPQKLVARYIKKHLQINV